MKSFIPKLTWANLIARPLATMLTIATLAAAVSLISVLLQFSAHTSDRLARDLADVDLVVGAKGSPLQLILSSVLHVDVPTGNIPLSDAQKIMRDQYSKTAIPLALGDSFRGFRIVGTNTEFIDLYGAEVAEGQRWTEPQQVVIGAQVASQLGMRLGQQFVGGHGLTYSDAELAEHDHATYEVVGILAPRASIIDRLILTSVDSVWHAHEEPEDEGEHDHEHEEQGDRGSHADDEEHHDHEAHEEDADHHDHEAHTEELEHHDHDEHHDESDHHAHEAHEEEAEHHGEDGHNDESDHHDHEAHDEDADHHDHEAHTLSNLLTMHADDKAITALLVQYTSPIAAVRMPRTINDQPGLQAASPALEMTRLFSLSAGLVDAGRILAGIMVVIGGLSIFVAVSNAAINKTYDIALLRAMGAKPKDVFLQQISEGIVIAALASIVGIGAAHLVLKVAASIYAPLSVFGLDGSVFFISELYLTLATLVVGIIAVVWPALNSYKVDPMLLLKGSR